MSQKIKMLNVKACANCRYYIHSCCRIREGFAVSMDPINVCLKHILKLRLVPTDANLGRDG